MREAQFEIGPNLLNMLIRIVGDKPAAMSLVGYTFSLLLHLACIMDRHLVLSRQGQGGPDPGILKGPLTISIKRDLDFNGALDAIWISASSLCPLNNGRE